jgi:hypothetical protein
LTVCLHDRFLHVFHLWGETRSQLPPPYLITTFIGIRTRPNTHECLDGAHDFFESIPTPFRLMDRIFPFQIDDRDLLRDSGFGPFKLQTIFAPSKTSGAKDLMTRGSWIRTVEIHLGPLGFGKIQTQISLTFCAFTRSCRSTDVRPLQSTVVLLLRDFDPFN